MAINIDVVADTSQVIGKTAEMADAYDDVSDKLKDMAKAGDRAGSDLEQSLRDGAKSADKLADNADDAKGELKDLGKAGKSAGDDVERGMRDGEDAAKKLDRTADDAFDAISAGARKSGREVSQSTKKGFDDASEGAETFKENAGANAKEVAASFDGSAESISDGFQGLAAEMLEGFGPAGLAAGVMVAVGIGLATTKLQGMSEENTAAKEAAMELGAAYADVGGDISKLDIGGVITAWGREVQEDNWLTFWKDEAQSNFQEYAGYAEDAGVAVGDAVRGMKGTVEDSEGFLDGTAGEWERLSKIVQENTEWNRDGIPVMNDVAEAADSQRQALVKLRDGAQDNIDTHVEAVEVYNIESESLGEVAKTAEEAAQEISDYASALDAAAGNAMSLTEAENAWTVELAASADAIVTNGKSMDIATEAGRANRETLVDLAQSANALRDAQIAQGQSTESVTATALAARNEFINQAIAAGMAEDAAGTLADSYGLIPGNVETLVAAHGTDEAKAKIDAIAVPTDAPVQVDAVGVPETQAEVNAVQGTQVEAEVQETGADATQSRINAIKGKDVKIDVDDEYTVRAVQQRINGIRGKDVTVRLNLDTFQFYRDLAAATQTRAMTVVVNERKGTAVI